MDRVSGGTKSVLIGGIQVSVLAGNLVKQKTDVLVCTTISALMLEEGRISKALLDAGGKSLQDECSKKYPNGLKGGDIAEVGPGKLQCKTVYFISIPMTDPEDVSRQESEVRKITNECLMKASKDNWSSVTFPALGTGNTGYQQTVVARVMFTTIEEFSTRHSSSVKNLDIIVHTKDTEKHKIFELEAKSRAFGHGHGATGHRNGLSNGFKSGPVTIQQGKLAEWTADILVCSCNRNMDLSKSGLARSLLQAGGNKLQSDCHSRYPNGISSGEVGVVSGNNLNCKHVYFGVLQPYTSPQSVQEMSIFISLCLDMAHMYNMTSIAFPTLGTGALDYPPKESAKTLSKCVKQFLNQNQTTPLQTIDVVIYDGERNWKDVMKAYHDEFSEKNVFQKVKSFFDPLLEGSSSHAEHPKPKGRGHSSSLHHRPRGPKPLGKPFETLPKLDMSDLQFSNYDEIGRGGFGVVFHGKWMGTDVAIKKMTLRSNSAEVIKMVEQEVKVHSRLRHPHIVQIMGVCNDLTSFYIISEFIDGSDLQNLIFGPGGSRLEPSCRYVYAKQCCQAVAYLHGVKPSIIHQDIKPSNVLVSKVTKQAKLCDFGISKIRSYSSKPTTEGTPYFMAPELLIGGKNSSFESDIWALGCTFIELFTELDLWALNGSLVTDHDIITLMTLKKKPPAVRRLDPKLPYHVRNAIENCVDYDPSKRPSALELVNEFDKYA